MTVHSSPRLILVNGPPGAGKSTLGRLLTAERPLSLLLDIDEIWTNIGGWREHDDAKFLARQLAVTVARTHLSEGLDVIVPQFLGRTDFIVTLEDVARGSGAAFIELLLQVPHETLVHRFEDRRRELAAAGRAHPQDAIADAGAAALLAETIHALERVVAARPTAVLVDARGDLDATAAAARAALHERRSSVS